MGGFMAYNSLTYKQVPPLLIHIHITAELFVSSAKDNNRSRQLQIQSTIAIILYFDYTV